MFKVIYGWGLRHTETSKLDLVDFGRNPAAPEFGRFGMLNVRYGKAKKGQPPRRRNVAAAIKATVTKQAHLQKLAWLRQDKPELLTGDGAKAPFPVVLRLIDALCETGAARDGEGRPLCPYCLVSDPVNLEDCVRCHAAGRSAPARPKGRSARPATRPVTGTVLTVRAARPGPRRHS